MKTGAGKHLAASVLGMAGTERFFFSTAASAHAVVGRPAVTTPKMDVSPVWIKTSTPGYWMQRGFGARSQSTVALNDEKEQQNNEPEKRAKTDDSVSAEAGEPNDKKGVVSYWGVSPSKVTKEDGSEWKWSCFRVCVHK